MIQGVWEQLAAAQAKVAGLRQASEDLARQLAEVLEVTNDNIRPPIIIQNRRNKQTFDTYAYTTDLVPLVLEKNVLQDIYMKYMGIMVKLRNLESVK